MGEDFGLFKGSKSLDYSGLWETEDCISEAKMERLFNSEGLRYKMNKTEQEASQYEPSFGIPFLPRVESVWEAIGFTATSNNEARQAEKLKAIEKAKTATKGVGPLSGLGGDLSKEGASQRAKWLEKYGYPRLVGSGGIFYADQLSTDKEAMGGFNMGKSGSIWPVPENVRRGQYGGAKGWGMKKKGTAVDGLEKVDM